MNGTRTVTFAPTQTFYGSDLLVTGAAHLLGYGDGSGGTVTQATSKSTGVTLNKQCGEITMNGAALAASTTVSFTLTNSEITAKSVIVLDHVTTGTFGAYTLNAHGMTGGSAVIDVRNVSLGSLSEAIVLKYCVLRSPTT